MLKIEELFEVQRYHPLIGWKFLMGCDRLGRSIIPNESITFTVATNDAIPLEKNKNNTIEKSEMLIHWNSNPFHAIAEYYGKTLLSPEWEWKTRWTPDTKYTKCDANGWSYGMNLSRLNRDLASGKSSARKHLHHFIRRRRWIRQCIKSQTEDQPQKQETTENERSRIIRVRQLTNPLSFLLHSKPKSFCSPFPVIPMKKGMKPNNGAAPHGTSERHKILRHSMSSLELHDKTASVQLEDREMQIEIPEKYIQKEGWLGKHAKLSKAWKLRYFLLVEDAERNRTTLMCLNDNKNPLLIGELYISDHTTITVDMKKTGIINIEKQEKGSTVDVTVEGGQYGFRVVNGDRKYRLNALSAEQRDEWVHAISQILIQGRCSYADMRLDPTGLSPSVEDNITELVDLSLTRKPNLSKTTIDSSWAPYRLNCCSSEENMDRLQRYYTKQYGSLSRELEHIAKRLIRITTTIFDEIQKCSNRTVNLEKMPKLEQNIKYLKRHALSVLENRKNIICKQPHVKEGEKRGCRLFEVNAIKKELYGEFKELIYSFATSLANWNVDWETVLAIVSRKMDLEDGKGTEYSKERKLDISMEPHHIAPPNVTQDTDKKLRVLYTIIDKYIDHITPSQLVERNLGVPSSILNLVIPVKDNDIGSLLSYALGSPPYQKRFDTAFHDLLDCERLPLISEGSLLCEDIHKEISGRNSVVEYELDSRKRAYLHILLNANSKSYVHAFDIKFQYLSSVHRMSYSVQCTCYYPLQYHCLRSFFPLGNYGFLQSLALSTKWETSGGKSGSLFSMSHDKRLVIKEIPASEFAMFNQMLPSYFAYIGKCLRDKRRTLLARILGLYKLSRTCRAEGKTKGHKHNVYVIVMQNVKGLSLHTHIYDLKGLVRRRFVDDTEIATASMTRLDEEEELETEKDRLSSLHDILEETTKEKRPFLRRTRSSSQNSSFMKKPAKVLQDGNFVDRMPVPVLSDDWKEFIHCMEHDTSFLSSVDVVDYSLLVVFNDVKRSIVVGIIDYLHQYNLLKRMESTSKTSFTFHHPTIVHPTAYRKRFLDAMKRYFVGIQIPIMEEEPRDACFRKSQRSVSATFRRDDIITRRRSRSF